MDWKNEQWLQKQYDSINGSGRENYLFVSLKIKRLRNINRIYGRTGGDELLELVYQIILNWLEPGEFAAHINCGHFNLLIHHVEQKDNMDYHQNSQALDHSCSREESVAARITQLSRQIRDMKDQRFTGSIFAGFGVYNLQKEPVTYEIAQFNAELCRSESAESAIWNSHLEIYGYTYTDLNLQEIDLRKSIVPAMEMGHIKLYLQPKVDMKTGIITGAEALVRWIDPVHGMIPLKDFLPALEINGLIQKLDLYLFDLVCFNIQRWKQLYGKEIKISVNLSKYYFNVFDFFDNYREVFERYHVPTECIEIELLESIVFSDTNRLQEVVSQIRNYGFGCALDDFGSGFSSYSILANANISVLKIDRSLFLDGRNEKERVVIEHIIKMAHELGMQIVAEGVETQEYVDYLQSIDCDYIQGFIFYKPMPVEEFESRFVRDNEKICFR